MQYTEYKTIEHLKYFEYCDYLQRKYGIPPCDYMTENWNRRPKVSRTKEGLFAHHKYENQAIMLSHKEYAQAHPREWQKAENIVYCDLLEHMLLHILICELPEKDKSKADGIVGSGGVSNYFVLELNDVYGGRIAKKEWQQLCNTRVKADRDTYLALLQRYQRTSQCNPVSFLVSEGERHGMWTRLQNREIYSEIIKTFDIRAVELYNWISGDVYIALLRREYKTICDDQRKTKYNYIAQKGNKKMYIKITFSHYIQEQKDLIEDKKDKGLDVKRYVLSLCEDEEYISGVYYHNIWKFLSREDW